MTISNGQALAQALNEKPIATLMFFSYGIMLRKQLENGSVTEYPVSASAIAESLAARVAFDTGLLGGNTLLIRQAGVKKLVVEYRPPQKTGIFLDGSDAALRVPLPGLILIRTTISGINPNYTVFAVKKRPTQLDAGLFHVPLPNVYSNGSICWGSVQRPAMLGSSLEPDWAQFLGSAFGNHAVGGKSKREPSDIRKLLIALADKKARQFPVSDLIPIPKTLAQILGEKP